MKKQLIKLDNVSKYYKTKSSVSVGMRNINLEFNLGEFVVVSGESGSGKTTLLNVLSGLDTYDDGQYFFNNKEITHYTVKDFEEFRSNYVGFIFQNYNVIESYTVYENVLVALEAQNYPKDKREERTLDLIDEVGLTSHINQKTSKLSGGEKQRVVIARALAKNAPIIFADEPTGNLDDKNGKEIMELLKKVSKDKLVILVTHNIKEAKPYATRNIVMSDGEIKKDEVVTDNKYITNETIKIDKSPTNDYLLTSKIAVRNLKSSPKRTIFQSLLFFFFVSLFLVGYTFMFKNLSESLSDSSQFKNVITISKRDNSSYELQDLEELKSMMSKEHKLVPNYLEKSKTIEVEDPNDSIIYNDYYNVSFSSSEILYKSEIKGNLPSNEKEVILTPSIEEAERFKIGDELNIRQQTFKIVGIYKGSLNNYYNTIFLSPDFIYNENYELINLDFFAHSLSSVHIDGEGNYINTQKLDEVGIRSRNKSQYKKLNNSLLKNENLTNKYRLIDLDLLESEYSVLYKTMMYLISFVGITIVGFIVFLLIYQIQKNVMLKRRVDFAVYRSIGISEWQSSLIIMFEQGILAIATSLISFATIKIIALFSNRVYLFTLNLRLIEVFLVSILLALYSLFLGRKYNKNIFSKTVIESLKGEAL